jgi:aryl-alcohol dehydrogenase-like predicted oxidoreductase
MTTHTTTNRTLGRSDITVSALGFGCWAIGGEWFSSEGQPWGWGAVDDEESVRALRRGIELGVTFFDTADTYGTGHSERVLGRALKGQRDRVVIASKWGNTFEDGSRRSDLVPDLTPAYARRALTDTLRRLDTDYLDLYQLHVNQAPLPEAAELRVVHAACACRVPERPAAAPPPEPAEASLEPDALREVLDRVLDDLGAAHHRPFSRG